MKKIVKVFNSLSITNIIIYLMFMYDSSRETIKKLIIFIFNDNIASKISEIYEQIIKYCKVEIYLFIISIMVYFVFFLIRKYLYQNKYLKRKQLKELKSEETQKVYKSIYEYLNSKDKRAFLLIGDWGSGKTYTINRFFNNYYKYQNRKVYKISCFGLEGRETILKEMKTIFETEDDSITKKILNLINKIPIIGDFLVGILKSDYELKDISQNSIFIFDDFERITPLGDINDRINKRKMRRALTRLQMSNRRMYNTSEHRSSDESSVEYQVLSRYNVVIGIINELVDRYDMKVIILCNTNEISKTFVHEMFECKLDCKKFRIVSNEKIFIELSNKILDNNMDFSLEKKGQLVKFFYDISDDINKIWHNTRIENIRILSGIISAFLELVENNDVDSNYYLDIFYSIYVYHILYYNDELDFFRNLNTGQNIYCYYQKLKKIERIKENDIILSIEDTKNKKAKWVGIEIASNWLVGENANCILNLQKMDDYDIGLEDYIVENKEIPKIAKYRFDDLMYILSCDNTKIDEIQEIIDKKTIDFEYRNYKRRNIEEDSLLLKIKPLTEYIKNNNILENQDFITVIFKKIYETYQYKNIDINSYIGFEQNLIKKYNEWIKSKEISELDKK